MENGEVQVTIPVQITVRIGNEASVQSGGAQPAASVAAVVVADGVPGVAADGAEAADAVGAEAARPRSYYDGYVGYLPDFLGVPVALPALSAEQRRNAAKNSAAAADADSTVLPYTHFSVVMNRRRSMAYYTVVNIDGSQDVPSVRQRDVWYLDSRIAEAEQIGPELYERNVLDRGHLVRRLDPVWGAEHERAEADTFHFTNCAPQHAKFNEGKDLWLGLESYILDHANLRDRKVTVFSGPVLDENDPLYKGVRLPLAFWKVIVYCRPDGTLVSAAYLLEQAKLIEDMLGTEAAFDPGVFRVGIGHLVERTGLGFGYLAEHELALSSDGLEAARDRVAVRPDYSNLPL